MDPVLHELAVKVGLVVVFALDGGFELDPVDGTALFCGFGVPYCVEERGGG